MRFGALILAWNGTPIRDVLGRVPVLWSEEPTATLEGRRLQHARFLVRGAVVDWKTAVIAVAALGFVLRFKNREPLVVVLAGVAGLVLH